MKRVILWKEIREQFPILLTLLVLGVGLITGVTLMVDVTDSKDGPRDLKSLIEAPRLALLMLICAGGMVTGGTLFAGERETGTFKYLTTMPSTLTQLWLAKVLAGLVLNVFITLGLVAVGAGTGLYSGGSAWVWVVWLTLCGLAAYAAATCGSVAARSGLVGCVLGGVWAGFWCIVGFILIQIFLAIYYSGQSEDRLGRETTAMLVLPLFVIPVSLFSSYRMFTKIDRQRRVVEHGPTGVQIATSSLLGLPFPSKLLGYRQLFWLTRRQLLWPAVWTFLIALLPAGAMAVKDVPPLLVWASSHFFFVTVISVVAFGDEQARGVSRYWSERQMPSGRLWLAKFLGVLVLGILLALWLTLPNYIATSARGDRPSFLPVLFRSYIVLELGPHFLYYLLTPLVYGISFGMASAVLFKKPVVAIGVALIVGAMMAVVWFPSFLSGGLHWWQVAAAPAVVLILARMLSRPWVNERLSAPPTLAKIAIGGTLALALTAFGIYWRAYEIPLLPTSEDDVAFSKSIPTYDEKQPGRELRAAASRYVEQMNKIQGSNGREGYYMFAVPPEMKAISNVCEEGWTNDAKAGAFLDKLYSKNWWEQIDKMRGKPPGVFVDPNEKVEIFDFTGLRSVMFLNTNLMARGLQEHSRGQPAKYVEMMDRALTVSRTIRHKSFAYAVANGYSQENPVHNSILPWLATLDGQPELLRKSLEVLHFHELNGDVDEQDMVLAHTIRTRLAYNSPQSWYKDFTLDFDYRTPLISGEQKDSEASVLAFAWTVPWEKERIRRAVGLYNSQEGRLIAYDYTQGLPGIRNFANSMYFSRDRVMLLAVQQLARTRLARVAVAIRLFEEENNKTPQTLNELVPKYLPSVPLDPYDGQPLRYRVSPGEVVFESVRNESGENYQLKFIQYDRLTLECIATVSSGLVLWTSEPPTVYPPGVIEGGYIDEEIYDAIGAVAGIAVKWPMFPIPQEASGRGPFGGPGYPPGIGSGGDFPPDGPVLSENEELAMGAVVGSTVMRNQSPIIRQNKDGTIIRADESKWWMYNARVITPGTPIVWSVGQDKINNDGVFQESKSYSGSLNDGDIIYIVPRKPQPGAKP